MLALQNVSKAYGTSKLLSNVSVQINPKDILCIVGSSGSGKTTILKLLLGLEIPTSGIVSIDGIDLRIVPGPVVQLYRRRIGVIFQEPILLTHATAAENIALPLELVGAPKTIIQKSVNDLLSRFHITEKAHLFPDELSLSERSLVAIARAIITAPMVMLADEPFANLDPDQQKVVGSLLLALHKQGTTLVIFSRTTETARALGARTILLENGTLTSTTEQKRTPDGPAHRILESQGSGRKIHITSIGALPSAS